MKKVLIGSLIGAVLVFGWQAVAHMFLHHHDDGYMRVASDAAVTEALTANIKTEGQYFVPGLDLKAPPDEQQKAAEKMMGKPWAFITYHPAYEADMGMSALRSFVTAFVCVLLFTGIMGKVPGSLGSVFFKGLGMGIFAFMFVWYNQNIWLQTPWSFIKGELIDDLVAWGLCGLWLGWWLNRIPAIKSNYNTIS